MSAEAIFVDTNILVYAHDMAEEEKRPRAQKALRQLWERTPFPWISVQVLQEFYATLLRKKTDDTAARAVIEDYLNWNVVPNAPPLLMEAISLRERWQLSFWDASILAAAIRAGAHELWSEDFQEGRDYSGIRIVNPLSE